MQHTNKIELSLPNPWVRDAAQFWRGLLAGLTRCIAAADWVTTAPVHYVALSEASRSDRAAFDSQRFTR